MKILPMASLAVLQKLQSQAALADSLLIQLRAQLEAARKSAGDYSFSFMLKVNVNEDVKGN